MPKRQAAIAPLRDTVCAAVRASVEVFQTHFDDRRINTIEHGGACIGVPLPALSLEFLLDTNIWPLGRVVQLNGLQSSMKSAFAFELARVFREHSGATWYHEVEGKFSETLCRSVIGWGADTAFVRDPCDSMDAWQQHVTLTLRTIRDIMDGKGKRERGTGRTWPVLEVIDSLTAKNLTASDDRIDKAGFASAAHPAEAGSITKFMKRLQRVLDHYPISMVIINHLKLQENPNGPQPIRHTPGGKHVAFQESLEIEFTRIGHVEQVDKEGLDVKLRVRKNALGSPDRSIVVPIRWWSAPQIDAQAGKKPVSRQRTVWDWYTATTKLLLNDKLVRRTAVREVIDVRAIKGKFWSKRLKISKDAPVSAQSFGRAIQRNDAVLRELRQVFGIKMRPVLDPRIGYAKQQATARALIDEEMEKTDDTITAQEVEVGPSAASRPVRTKPTTGVRRKRPGTSSG
jgi:RecA/RadA recombinase